jgi:Holliday junction resolvase
MKKGYSSEVERKKQLEKENFHCTRNSGSIGATDLIAVRWNGVVDNILQANCFEVRYEQVKKTRDKTFYFNPESKDELRRLKEISLKFSIPCFFSIKFTNKGWKIISVDKLDGKPIKSNAN